MQRKAVPFSRPESALLELGRNAKWLKIQELLTKTTTSLVAKANMSAQETLFLHPGTLSTAALALITVSNPSPASERFSALSFSEVWLFV